VRTGFVALEAGQHLRAVDRSLRNSLDGGGSEQEEGGGVHAAASGVGGGG